MAFTIVRKCLCLVYPIGSAHHHQCSVPAPAPWLDDRTLNGSDSLRELTKLKTQDKLGRLIWCTR